MADNQLLLEEDNGVGGGDDVFVYTGGDQEVPDDVERVCVAENVDTIPAWTFEHCEELIEVKAHNKLRKVEQFAFHGCTSLKKVKNMQGLIEIEEHAFLGCHTLEELEFGKLEIIGLSAFQNCRSLRSFNMPSVKRVEAGAFMQCVALTDVVFGQDLERIEDIALHRCTALRRIAIPLKYGLFIGTKAFHKCKKISRVDILDGEIHGNITSLHMKVWRDEIENEIDRINQTLPNTPASGKTQAIQQWIERVLGRIKHYRNEHKVLVKEAMALLELALWKAKLLNEMDEKKCNMSKKAKIDDEAARKEHRVTCGASIVIKNVLPFLALE